MKNYSMNRQTVVAERFDKEVVLVHLETGAYYSLSGSAGAIWAFLDAGFPSADIARQLGAAANSAEIEEFLESLEKEGLIRPEENLPPASAPPAIELGGYSRPAFEKFGDMADLILLDPIHDVDAEGWPLRPAKEEIPSN